ncbi:MAG: ABC transporter substrate-binding protein [Chlamydiota bacterium]
MRKLFKYLSPLLTAVLLASFTGCSNGNDSKKASSDQSLSVGLNPWIGTGLFYVAKEKGLFSAENINVNLVQYDEGGTGKQLLSSGKIDMLATTPETVIVCSDAGVSVKVVGILDSSRGADGIVATKDITTISDLKGKTVAFEVGSSSHLLLSFFLKQQGLTTKDLVVENLSAADAGAAFVEGKVDAAVTWEPWLSKATQRPGGHILVDSKSLEIFPDFYIFRAAVVEQKPNAIRSMLRALFAARKFTIENPDEALQIMAKNLGITPAEAATEVKTLEWLDYAQNVLYFGPPPSKAEQLIQDAADLWLELGLIQNKIQARDIVDSTPLKNLYQ